MKPLVTNLLISFLTLTSCSLLGGGDSAPDIPGKIVFSAKDDEGTSQIYTMNANGTDVKQLTHFDPSEGAYQPSWSPDGQQILFSSFKSGSSIGPALWVMDVDGSNPHLLYKVEGSSRALEGNHARWSPDGSKVAFDLCLNCQIRTNNDIYLFDTRSKQLTQLTQDSASDTNPTWSPDGSRIAFVSDRDYLEADTMRYRTDLYIVYADGSNLSRLTQTGNATRPAWNPNGKTIAYEWNRQGNNIFLVNVSTGNITTVKSGLQFSGYPMWNKDGTKMLVSGRVIEKSKPEMRLLNIMDSSADIFQKIELDEKAVGRDYDWYISSKN